MHSSTTRRARSTTLFFATPIWGTRDRKPSEIEIEHWSKWPDAGVCVAIDYNLKILDIDTDDSALMGAVLSVAPFSDIIKRGAKGFSAFYRGSPAIVSQPFSVGKERVVDLLCHGRQTVLPPTVHPTTGLPLRVRTISVIRAGPTLTDAKAVTNDPVDVTYLPPNLKQPENGDFWRRRRRPW